MEIKNKYNVGDYVYAIADNYGRYHCGVQRDTRIVRVRIIGVGGELTENGIKVRYRISEKGDVIPEDALWKSPEDLKAQLEKRAQEEYNRILDRIESMAWLCTASE